MSEVECVNENLMFLFLDVFQRLACECNGKLTMYVTDNRGKSVND